MLVADKNETTACWIALWKGFIVTLKLSSFKRKDNSSQLLLFLFRIGVVGANILCTLDSL